MYLGCEVNWNVGDCMWDCFCYGFCFFYDGFVVEGFVKKLFMLVDVDLSDKKSML